MIEADFAVLHGIDDLGILDSATSTVVRHVAGLEE